MERIGDALDEGLVGGKGRCTLLCMDLLCLREFGEVDLGCCWMDFEGVQFVSEELFFRCLIVYLEDFVGFGFLVVILVVEVKAADYFQF